MNLITPNAQEQDLSDDMLIRSTIFLSFTAIIYGIFYMKQQIDGLTKTKQDININMMIEDDVYQAWTGTYADGENSLLLYIIRKKLTSREKNARWVEWDQSEDTSVTSRNFYLGNLNPSFTWSFKKREADIQASVQDTLMDGWNSVISMKFDGFVKEEDTDEKMNAFFRQLISNNRIEWQKILLSKEEFTALFD